MAASCGGLQTTLLLHVSLPALGVDNCFSLKLNPQNHARIIEQLGDFVEAIETEFREYLVDVDRNVSQSKMEYLSKKTAQEVEEWRARLKKAEDSEIKVARAMTQMNKMRDCYYKELLHLREQIYRQKKEGDSFVPNYAFHFDPAEYVMDDEVKRLVNDKVGLIQQEFETKLAEQVATHARTTGVLKEKVKTTTLKLNKTREMIDKLMSAHGYDNEDHVLETVGSVVVNEERIEKKMEREISKEEKILEKAEATKQVVAANKVAASPLQEVLMGFHNFLQRKYGSIKTACSCMKMLVDDPHRVGVAELTKITNDIGYATRDVRTLFKSIDTNAVGFFPLTEEQFVPSTSTSSITLGAPELPKSTPLRGGIGRSASSHCLLSIAENTKFLNTSKQKFDTPIQEDIAEAPDDASLFLYGQLGDKHALSDTESHVSGTSSCSELTVSTRDYYSRGGKKKRKEGGGRRGSTGAIGGGRRGTATRILASAPPRKVVLKEDKETMTLWGLDTNYVPQMTGPCNVGFAKTFVEQGTAAIPLHTSFPPVKTLNAKTATDIDTRIIDQALKYFEKKAEKTWQRIADGEDKVNNEEDESDIFEESEGGAPLSSCHSRAQLSSCSQESDGSKQLALKDDSDVTGKTGLPSTRRSTNESGSARHQSNGDYRRGSEESCAKTVLGAARQKTHSEAQSRSPSAHSRCSEGRVMSQCGSPEASPRNAALDAAKTSRGSQRMSSSALLQQCDSLGEEVSPRARAAVPTTSQEVQAVIEVTHEEVQVAMQRCALLQHEFWSIPGEDAVEPQLAQVVELIEQLEVRLEKLRYDANETQKETIDKSETRMRYVNSLVNASKPSSPGSPKCDWLVNNSPRKSFGARDSFGMQQRKTFGARTLSTNAFGGAIGSTAVPSGKTLLYDTLSPSHTKGVPTEPPGSKIPDGPRSSFHASLNAHKAPTELPALQTGVKRMPTAGWSGFDTRTIVGVDPGVRQCSPIPNAPTQPAPKKNTSPTTHSPAPNMNPPPEPISPKTARALHILAAGAASPSPLPAVTAARTSFTLSAHVNDVAVPAARGNLNESPVHVAESAGGGLVPEGLTAENGSGNVMKQDDDDRIPARESVGPPHNVVTGHNSCATLSETIAGSQAPTEGHGVNDRENVSASDVSGDESALSWGTAHENAFDDEQREEFLFSEFNSQSNEGSDNEARPSFREASLSANYPSFPNRAHNIAGVAPIVVAKRLAAGALLELAHHSASPLVLAHNTLCAGGQKSCSDAHNDNVASLTPVPGDVNPRETFDFGGINEAVESSLEYTNRRTFHGAQNLHKRRTSGELNSPESSDMPQYRQSFAQRESLQRQSFQRQSFNKHDPQRQSFQRQSFQRQSFNKQTARDSQRQSFHRASFQRNSFQRQSSGKPSMQEKITPDLAITSGEVVPYVPTFGTTNMGAVGGIAR
eukprot:GEMP01001040.1.p1 GENE.GEMP01001040.1~~GEMP01001040.1.p1  ORF type:complete len:1435 (+),score=361.23 GEMP01001040.1:344-4648(+)